MFIRYVSCNIKFRVVCAGPSGLQPLRVDLNVMLANTIATGPDLQPQLEGQEQATATDDGNITIKQLVLRAAPGDYLLSVTLLDHPQVAGDTDLVTRGQHLCMLLHNC